MVCGEAQTMIAAAAAAAAAAHPGRGPRHCPGTAPGPHPSSLCALSGTGMDSPAGLRPVPSPIGGSANLTFEIEMSLWQVAGRGGRPEGAVPQPLSGRPGHRWALRVCRHRRHCRDHTCPLARSHTPRIKTSHKIITILLTKNSIIALFVLYSESLHLEFRTMPTQSTVFIK